MPQLERGITVRNIIHVTTSDATGGASRAVLRLHQGLRKIHRPSCVVVGHKTRDRTEVLGPRSKWRKVTGLVRPHIDRLPLYLYPRRRDALFHPQWLPGSFKGRFSGLEPYLIHLHWICDGFMRIEALSEIKGPIVWTLHDMWPFTGGCHYTGTCEKFRRSCGSCPNLGSDAEFDLSRWVWRRKKKAWQNLDLTIVTPSRWLAECARESFLFRERPIKVIPNGLDLRVYKPVNRKTALDLLGLLRDKRTILFGAVKPTADERKGFHFLKPVFDVFAKTEMAKETQIVIFGAAEPHEAPDLGLPTYYMGFLYDDVTLNLLYAAADVMLVPSMQEAFGQTASESLACGTPVVAFNVTGLRDIVDHKSTGYLAPPFDVIDFGKGIAWVLANEKRGATLASNARKKALRAFDIQSVAEQYAELYQEVLD